MRPAFFFAVLSGTLVAAQWKLECAPFPTDSCQRFCPCNGGLNNCAASAPSQCHQYCLCVVDNSIPPPPYSPGRDGGRKPNPPKGGSSPRRGGKPKRLARRIVRN